MNKDNAHLYLPLVAALAAGKTIQRKVHSFPGGWADAIGGPSFLLDPEYYRVKPEFTPPAEIYLNELCNSLLSGWHASADDARREAAAAGIVATPNVIRFRLDDSYTPPDPVSGFTNVYPTGCGGIYTTLSDLPWTLPSLRIAKMVEVPPRIVYLHHDPEAGESVARAGKEYISRFTITHQYVECWD